jgi:hypothetical protein
MDFFSDPEKEGLNLPMYDTPVVSLLLQHIKRREKLGKVTEEYEKIELQYYTKNEIIEALASWVEEIAGYEDEYRT